MEDRLEEILNEIYDAYEYAVNDASSLWISEFSCSNKETENRQEADKEDLFYFQTLLAEIKDIMKGN